MYARIAILTILLCGIMRAIPVQAQQDTKCSNTSDLPITKGEVFFNYGSSTDAFSIQTRSSFSLGEPVVGTITSPANISQMGSWSRYLVAPFAPFVTATQGEILDRIRITWEPNVFGGIADQGFNVYRDGTYLATVGSGVRNYSDFNVIAGIPYNYEVRGKNLYGEGPAGHALGFQVPNGVVTGWVQTGNGSPVSDAIVTLMPMQGTSLKFDEINDRWDGAFWENDSTGLNPMLPAIGQDWTITFWLKTVSSKNNAGIMQFAPIPLYIRALNSSSGQEGVEIATLGSGPAFLTGAFPDSLKNDWHHIALSYDGTADRGRLYIDGQIQDMEHMDALQEAEALYLGNRTDLLEGWKGSIDELRVYHRRLDELDLNEVMSGTASSLTPNLQYYWKFDESQGTRSFDIIRRKKLYFCGAKFDQDRPTVRTSGKTNSEGFYRIESANYGTGTTFLAEPVKNFYKHRSTNLIRKEMDYDSLPNFSLTPRATLELWVNSAGPDGVQCLVSKRWDNFDFRIMLDTNNIVSCYLNGDEQSLGALGIGFQHLAFTIDNGSNTTITAYQNGQPLGAPAVYPGITGNWSDDDQAWLLGARPSGAGPMNNNIGTLDNFGGLIDEFAVYDTILPVADIQYHAENSRDMHEKGLRVYFALDEGNGSILYNSGSVFLPTGKNKGADWSPLAANQSTTPHVFTPKTRQVTLNPSVTSVDQVDFVDRSTVTITGFVRYKDTDCFAKNVEILVNGESHSPKIFTDSTGKFVIDFDPGTTARLRPTFQGHLFVPAFFDVTNVVNPVAGILFNDITTRNVKGKVAGGTCKKSIIKAPPGSGQGTVCTVKIRSADGCLERQITLDNQEGEYEFADLPPMEGLTVAVVEHSDPDIKTFFQVLGGTTIDLLEKDTVVDFTYFAPPEVEIASGLDPFSPDCPTIVLDQGDKVTVEIKMKEQYVEIKDNMGTVLDDGVCHLDTANLSITNGFADTSFNIPLSNGLLTYSFQVGNPNPSPPYLKTLQIVGTTLSGREGSISRQAVITGIINKGATFTTLLPETPSLVLRDPPGDGSSAFLEKNTKVCRTHTFSFVDNGNFGGGIELHLGGAIQSVLAPLGVGVINSAGPIIDNELRFNYSLSVTNDSVLQTCFTNSIRISTSSGDLFVGEEADLYMGDAINLKFGFADKVAFDSCMASAEVILNIEPGNQPTTFIYSQAYIKNYQIPYLELLRDSPSTPPDSIPTIEASISRWNTILQTNKELKEKAKFERNLSFDALNTIEYSETSDTNVTFLGQSGSGYDISSVSHFGFQFNNFGAQAIIDISGSTSTTTGTGGEVETGITTGYTLADDDPFDAFSLDVLIDPHYKTPVFDLYAGQSSCPWEVGTANREGPNLNLAQGADFVAVNVPANEAAVFQMNLGNLSATNEDWTYGFTSVAANNPDGAIIKLNGQPLNNNTIQYIVPYGSSIPITLTVERGPIAYDYDSLLVALVSECEMARNFALSLPLDGDPKFFSPLYLGAHFIRPCSEVAITVPEQNWVVFPDPITPGPDDVRRITVSGYDLNSTDFQLVRVQYRRSDGDGAWINIPGVSDRYNPNWSGYDDLPDPKPPVLEPSFTQFFWETTGLADGDYEIHAWAVCTGDAADKPGFSQIIKGRIDREPPSLVGTPQPSDGVYNVGDEISFTFNQYVNCNKLIPADQSQANNVGLYDATTGQLIDIDITCFENKIVLDPNFQNKFFENRILRAELHDIEDLTGNKGTAYIWEFYVDRNELAWLTDSLGVTKFEDETKTAIASIHNRGGYPVPFEINDVPDWVHVVPDKGTLAANEIRAIHFTLDSTLAFGRLSDSITLHTVTGQNPFFMGGDEGLPIGVRIVCRPPILDLDPVAFENSENMVVELNINGQTSADVEDMVIAYMGDTLCGRANIQYVPQLDKYLAYLTIYGYQDQIESPIRLEIWDASACLRYAVLEDYFIFQPDIVIGDPINPQVLHAENNVLRDVPLGDGWNWLSFNLAFPDPNLNAALASLHHPENDLINGQNSFSVYFDGSWFGSLQDLGNTSMYIYRSDQADTLNMLGAVIDPASMSIPVVAGWNWIGYIPNYSLSVNDALSSLTNTKTGDLIKSQTAFAQYINPVYGWIGNLKFMQPPLGYQLRLSGPGSLLYPPPGNGFNSDGSGKPDQALPSALIYRDRPETNPPVSNFWTVDPTQYEFSSTLIGMLAADGTNATTAAMELGAFTGNDIRGSGQAIYIEPLEAYLFFLTTYANAAGEQLHYKLYDGNDGSIRDLAEKMYFTPELHQGSIEMPVPFSLPSTNTREAADVQFFDVQPNPFHTETMFRFGLQEAQEVQLTITSLSGSMVSQLRTAGHAGLNALIWKGQSDTGSPLAPGVYFVRLQTETGSVVRKVVLQ